MKKLTKLLCIALSAILVVPMFACSCGGTTADPNTIKFEFLDAGFGTKPYQALKEAFEAKYPQYKVELIANRDIGTTIQGDLESGDCASIYSYTSIDNLRLFVNQNDWVEDLTDLCTNTLIPDDNRTIKEALTGNAANCLTKKGETGHIYAIPEYTSVNGYVYNQTVIDDLLGEGQWEEPTTTKELKEFCDNLISAASRKGKTSFKPIIYCDPDAGGYLYDATENWFSQYEGVDRMNAFYNYGSAEIYNPTETATNGSISDGKKKALEMLKTFYTNSNYIRKVSTAKAAQQELIDGNAGIMINGSWFENEMGTSIPATAKMKMFAIPQLSDDAGNVLYSDFYTPSETDKRVLTANYESYYFIPKNMSEERKASAKEFLLFLSSKEGCKIYTQNSNAIRPFDYDLDSSKYENMGTFGKSVLDIAKNNTLFSPVSNSVIVLNGHGGLWPNQSGRVELSVISGSKTIEAIINDCYSYANSHWNEWLGN